MIFSEERERGRQVCQHPLQEHALRSTLKFIIYSGNNRFKQEQKDSMVREETRTMRILESWKLVYYEEEINFSKCCVQVM